jgi:hypothetical protein
MTEDGSSVWTGYVTALFFEFDAASSGGFDPLRGRVHHASRFRGSD